MKLRVSAIALACALSTAPALAATAYWTGKMRFVTTVTYQQGVSCEYNYIGRTFWRTFIAQTCPNSVEVQ